jgi:hypothetical protein
MNTRATVVATLAISMLLPYVLASASDENIRRARVPNTEALRIAAELFPEKCGRAGEFCGITYGADYCPLQFVITFPKAAGLSTSEPTGAWVTVNPRGRVIEVSSTRSKECRNGIAS